LPSDLTVPTGAADTASRHYAKQQRVSTIAAADVLAGNSDLAQIADDIVLVDTSAAAVINDLQATPIAPNAPRFEIHAQLLDKSSCSRSSIAMSSRNFRLSIRRCGCRCHRCPVLMTGLPPIAGWRQPAASRHPPTGWRVHRGGK
jgi:hypothetical protein